MVSWDLAVLVDTASVLQCPGGDWVSLLVVEGSVLYYIRSMGDKCVRDELELLAARLSTRKCLLVGCLSLRPIRSSIAASARPFRHNNKLLL